MARYNDNYDNRGTRRFEENYGTNSSPRNEEWNQGDQNIRNRGPIHQGMQGGHREHEGPNNYSGDYRGRYDYESTPDNRQRYSPQGQWGGNIREEFGTHYGNQPQSGGQSYGHSNNQEYDNLGYNNQSYGSEQGSYSNPNSGYQQSGNRNADNQQFSNSGRGNTGRMGNSGFEGSTGYGAGTQQQVPTYRGTAGSGMPGQDQGNQWSGGQWNRNQGNYGGRQDMGMYGQEYSRGRQESQAHNTFGDGPHRGRGPKGFQRSDERIREEVCERLSDHGYLDASDIEVEVKEGEVILKGTVQSRQDKRTAENMAESLSGVADVLNQLRIQRDNGSENTSQQNTSSSTSKQQHTQSSGNGSYQTQQAKSTSNEDVSTKNTKK